MEPLRLALVGAGNRGRGLAGLARKAQRATEIVAVIDPVAETRQDTATALAVPASAQFAEHRRFLDANPQVDGAIVATEVSTHADLACDLLEAGIPVFLEKPMTRTIDEALRVRRTARATRVPIMIGFNLRHAPFYRRLNELTRSGVLGQLISIEWKEILSPQAWADGYCRASWYSRTETVGGWLLEKSCHDIDQINWLAAAPCRRVASFGSRQHFLPRNDVPKHCTDGCPIEKECLFSCLKFHPNGPDETVPNYVPAERWNLCVYHCGSDLADRQVAILEYENGITAAFTIVPVGYRWERTMRICGTKATLSASDHDRLIQIAHHANDVPDSEQLSQPEGGHGGADPAIVNAFLHCLPNGPVPAENNIDVGVESMLAAAGIETARMEGRVVELDHWRQSP